MMLLHTLIVRVRLLLLVLIALALLLAGLLWHGVSGEALRVMHPAMQDLPDEHALLGDQLGNPRAALERPLFWQARKPVAAGAASTAAEVSGKAEGFKLLGVVMDKNTSTALLGTPKGVKRVGLDEKVQGWTVEKVTSKSVILTSAGQRVELSVLTSRNPGIRLVPTEAE
ncbi:MAG: hypothetical protein V4812_00070 [Pseudomonadota bacterium]